MNRICTILMVGSLWMSPVYAWQWQAVWKTQDQRAKIMMDAGNYAKAADMFQRRDWRATAAFRAGDTERAAREYAQLGTADGHYNAGNALAQMGHYQQAIAQYDQALALNAQHEDAAYNRRLVQAMLDQQKSRDKQQQDKQQTKPSEEKGKGKPNSASSQQNPKDTSQQQSSASPEKKPDSENPSSPKKTDSEKASEPSNQNVKQPQQLKKAPTTRAEREQQKANEQWLQLIPDDPGGLLREKFKRDHLKKQGEWQS